MELSLPTDIEVVEGQNGDAIGIAVCSLCAAILPARLRGLPAVAHRLARDRGRHRQQDRPLMATIVMVGTELEEPRFKLIRAIPWGDGYRYLIAEGPASPSTYLTAFTDTCSTFPSHPVFVAVDWGNACEVVTAQHYCSLRPILMGL
jgi:hypothetical protein